MAQNRRPGIIQKYITQTLSTAALAPSLAPVGSTDAAKGFGLGPGLGLGLGTLPSMPSFSSFSLSSLPSPSVGTSASGGNYMLQVLFFFFLYGFVLFLLLILIHYTVRPVFQFVPGGSGILPISTTVGYRQYWNSGAQPLPTDMVPSMTDVSDPNRGYPFLTKYSFSVDILVTDMSKSSLVDRLIFYKAAAPVVLPTTITSLEDTMAALPVSMICYLSDTNDLIVTHFSGQTAIRYNSFPIKNIPLYTPFRITHVFDTNIFTIYLNGMQVSQTTAPAIQVGKGDASPQRFFANMATGTSKCAYVQNLLLWNRPIQYSELNGVQVALTGLAKFGATPSTATSNTCSS